MSMESMGFFQSMQTTSPAAAGCYCFPGDACWPSTAAFSDFNHTVGGQLIATTPIASVCHDGDGPFGSYDAEKCAQLQSEWFLPQTHLPSSSSAMAMLFTNNSCNPFLPPQTPCTLGNSVSYAVKVRTVADAQKTLTFAQDHNIRLVIRNTGHDYNGKSTGAGALSIWTQDLNSIELLDSRNWTEYEGRALKLGAGVQVYDAYQFADVQGILVGGNCPTIGIAGGLAQGGGRGPLATAFGLVADQVLEWEVLTSSGELLTASPIENQDMYWALFGGGGSTYGVVMSVTMKLHAPVFVSSTKLIFATPSNGPGIENYWGAVKTFTKLLPAFVDAGLEVTFTVAPGAFIQALDDLFQPILTQLTNDGIQYQYQSQQFPSFLQSYQAMNLPGANVSDSILGGRLLPRSVVEDNIDQYMEAVRYIIDASYIFVGLVLDVSQTPASKVAVNPYWRKTLISSVLGTYYDYQNYTANLENQKYMTNTLIPKLSALTGDPPAASLNEADFLEPNWQSVLYGQNYERLDRIKRRYDPKDTFYALGAVGSDRWTQKGDGRLCKA
ncbi:FAD-binding domain-containing protein [Byssothecium circinans]|uniref:FAD-binding domain-containing protein n=1 Tax=Byssothecium circinans TaxID=147558 RepID=A0A6A5TPB7_9PLEO|nr:FAD-binding domain-containing protein [Byssothecium circinans]